MPCDKLINSLVDAKINILVTCDSLEWNMKMNSDK